METQLVDMLTSNEEATLLTLARDTLLAFVQEDRILGLEHVATTPTLVHKRASFVTLRESTGALRGCIGSTVHTVSLMESVRDNTIRSAAHDPRFNAVTMNELAGLTIEISALEDGDAPDTPFCRVTSLDEIVIGRDGLYLERAGGGGGLLLPQVASERNWNIDQFVEALCGKAGMPPGALESADATLYRFGSHVFQQ